MSPLPEWMLPQANPEKWNSVSHAKVQSRRRSSVRRAVGGFAHVLARAFTDDASAASKGMLQGIDARMKVLGLLGMLVVVTFLRSFPALAMSYGVCLLLTIMSRIPARRLAAVWIAAPLFSAAIMLPATLNLVSPGRPLWVILGSKLAVTDVGLLVAARFILRTAVCVSLVTLLTATTQRVKLFRGLRMLGVPQIFVTLLSMMERYLGVLVQSAEEIHLAKISRSILPGSLRQEKAWAAAGIGSLFRRSYSLSHAVYLAMVSRGYTGEVYCLDEPVLRARDWAFVSAVALICIVLLVIG